MKHGEGELYIKGSLPVLWASYENQVLMNKLYSWLGFY